MSHDTGSAPGTDQGFRCGICNKTFERRDLRERHKRRCVTTFDKPRRSKQRSCNACVQSKLGCDQQQPSCRRCISRNVECEYVNDAGDSEASVSGIGMGATGRAEMTGLTGASGSTGPSRKGLQSPAHQTSLGQLNGNAFSQMPPSLDFGNESTGFSAHDMGDLSSATGSRWNPRTLQQNNLQEAFNFTTDFDLTNQAMDWLGSNEPTAAQDVGMGSSVGGLGTASRTSSSAPMSTSSDHRQRTQMIQETETQPKTPLTSEEMVNIIMGYLPMMVAQEPPAPPYVHDQIYRCGEGDVEEPIARLMVCINAHKDAMPSGRKFVQGLLNTERNGLIQTFPQCSTQTDMIASLHAMVVFQILGFFGQSIESPKDAELHQPFLLKFARRIGEKFRDDLTNTATDIMPSWKYWCFIETVRRTLFLAHVINVLAARLKKQNPFYYEPLDDELIMSMPLPAPAGLWEAESEAQWLSARGSFAWKTTIGYELQDGDDDVGYGDQVYSRLIHACLAPRDLPSIGTF